MNDFKRNILLELEEWRKRTNRKPLVIRGARQVGKTTVVRQFASQFKYFISLIFSRRNGCGGSYKRYRGSF